MSLGAAPVAPLGAHQGLVFLLQVGVLLGLALALGQLARRLKMPAVVGELTAGVLAGPSVLAHLAPGVSGWLFPADAGQVHLLDAVGMAGVLLLVGITGISIDLGLVRRQGAPVVWVSMGGLLVALASGLVVGLLLPDQLLAGGTPRSVFAGFIGVAMCVSAIPVIAKTLLELRLLHRDIGQLTISAAAIDDVVGWMLLSVVSAMATTGVRAGQVALSIAALLGVILFVLTVGRVLVGAMLRLASKSAEPGVTVMTTVTLVILFSAGTHALGMEAILGALACGMLIGSSKWVDHRRLAPLRTVVMAMLAPVFFAVAGLRMDLTELGRPVVLGWAAVVLVVAVGGKFAGVYLGARVARLGHWNGMALGAGMNARGVIEVIIAMAGLRLGVLTTAMYTIIVLVAIVTSVMAPPLLRYATRHIAVTADERKRGEILVGG
jgi:Kef-type K+ transport system membrane component KefB